MATLQPTPLACHLAYRRTPPLPGSSREEVLTAIARTWAPGDAERCGLCPAGTCCEAGGICLLVVRGRVAPSAAWHAPLPEPPDVSDAGTGIHPEGEVGTKPPTSLKERLRRAWEAARA